jgi:3-oxosteroid 1-dehydrogenase
MKDKDLDIVVMGSGAAGLTAALFAARSGARVLVLEKTPLLGGTSAISGGQVWIPNNHHMPVGSDSPALAQEYLAQVTLGEVDADLLASFVASAPSMLAEVERLTPLRFAPVDRPDYHSEWRGAVWGRSLEPLPFDVAPLAGLASTVRRSPYRLPLTSAESKQSGAAEIAQKRQQMDHTTQGVALIGGLLQGCTTAGVGLSTHASVIRVERNAEGLLDVHVDHEGRTDVVRAKAIVIAAGGFEWNDDLKHAFLPCPDEGAASPPWNVGNGLRVGLAAGAALANMSQAWWSAAFRVPGEAYDGQPLVRNIVRELALPGSIIVNADGRRFANEASSYNALGKAFQVFDPGRNAYPNRRAWLVFDDAFKQRYPVATVAPGEEAPAWFARGESVAQLARSAGINAAGLQQTVERFNEMARAGRDRDFGRGDAKHDQYHGDATQRHPNLGPLTEPPFHAVPIFLGNLGTKGGLKTDAQGRVQSLAGGAVPGFFACGNAAASWLGPGYPGAGGSLGPIMTAAFLCGAAAANDAAGAAPVRA